MSITVPNDAKLVNQVFYLIGTLQEDGGEIDGQTYDVAVKILP